MAISDRVTVLRDGRMAGTRSAQGVTRDDLVKMMVGREIKPLAPQPKVAGKIRLKVEGLRAMGDRGVEALRGVDLEIHAGEILGLAGVSGNGQRELAQCLAGLRKTTGGALAIDGQDMTHASLHTRMAAGQAYIPKSVCVTARSVTFRCRKMCSCMSTLRPSTLMASSWISARWQPMPAIWSTNIAVKTPRLDTPIKSLSGGNIQS